MIYNIKLISIQRHFETKYSTTVRFPQYVGVRIGKTAIIPAEFCNVKPGQVFRKKIPPEIQKAFLDFVTQKPDQRFNAITSAVREGVCSTNFQCNCLYAN